MGPSEGEPTLYHWPLYLHAARLFLPLLFIALLFRAPNRTRNAWWVALALLLPLLLSWGIEKSGVTRFILPLHDSYTVFVYAMAFLWLLADKLGGLSRIRSLVYAAVILLLSGVIGLFGLSALRLDTTTIVYYLFAGVALATLTLAGVACRKRYTPKRFLLWHFIIAVPCCGILAILVGGLLVFLPRLIAGDIISERFIRFNLRFVVLPMGLGGLALFAAMAPFVALALWNQTYRSRFHAIFRLPGMDSMEEDERNDENRGGNNS